MAGKIVIDTERCKGCGLCIAVCPKGNIVISAESNKSGYFPAEAQNAGCTACTKCAVVCPEGIIEIYLDEPDRSGSSPRPERRIRRRCSKENGEPMDPKVKRLVDKVKAHLHERYGDSIKRVILYGSHARGEATEDSDIDVLVLVDSSLNPSKVREGMGDFLFDIVLEESEVVSVIVLPEDFFETRDLPFMLNVRKEGIAV
jgi:Fe-S-cluster-containing hydrogenase component 2